MSAPKRLASAKKEPGFSSGKGTRLAIAVLSIMVTGWHAYLSLPSEDAETAVVVFLLGMAPYVVLGVLARGMRYPAVAAVGGVVLMGTDVSAGYSALTSTSSTGGVALLTQPLFGLFVVIPVAVFVAWLLGRTLDVDSS